MAAAISSTKSALRKEIANAIERISMEERKRQSEKVHQKLFSLRQYRESQRVSVYLSTKSEIDTVPILKKLFESGKEVFVPRYKGKCMDMVKLNSMEDYDKLPLTRWNIKQPDSTDIRESALETGGLDLVILPGVGFTRDGKRLGHGMGYYDKYLANCIASQAGKLYLIGLAFNEQLMLDIPTTEKDVPLHVVITERDS